MVDRTGEQVGNYRLVKLLGSGGFADVYLGQQVYLDSAAAIKLLHTRLAQDDWENFRAEARILVGLVHPHIIRLLDFGSDHNTPFLVMDYAPNGTLRQRVHRGEQLPLATVVEYTNQVASALQYAHNQKLIHRDIKPENMLIGRNNEILLTDFGIAIVAQSTLTQFTQEAVGTIAYMAPEQIQSHPRAASDQYSLAVVVYEWLTGKRPFDGAFTELAVKHMMAAPPPLHEAIPDIPPDVERVVLTALAKDPKQRFGSVQAFATALERAAKDALGAANQVTIIPASQELRQLQQLAPPVQPIKPVQKPQQVQQFKQPPVVLPNPATPVLPIIPVNNPQSNPGAVRAAQPAEAAPMIFTDPLRAQGLALPEGGQPATLTTPDRQQSLPPFQPQRSPASPQSPQRSTAQAAAPVATPARSGISRRAFLYGGLVAAAVVVAGGATLYAVEGRNTNNTGTGGTPPPPTSTTPHTTAPTIIAQDTFHRTNQQFWGTASSGQQWQLETPTANNFSIVNNSGQIQISQGGNAGEQTAILGNAFSDGEALVTGTASTFTNDNQLGVALRWTDDLHYYKAYLTNNQFLLIKRMGNGTNGVPISRNIPFTLQTGVTYSIRFRIVGDTMEARAWQSDQTEPTGWMLQVTDNNRPFQSGFGGIRTNVIAGATLTITSFELLTANSL